MLIDGRNRLRACALVKIEPLYTTFEGDESEYIVTLNVRRRHLSKGQRAMIVAMGLALARFRRTLD